MSKTARIRCTYVCNNTDHKVPKPCFLDAGHTQDRYGPTVLEPTGDGEFIAAPSWYSGATECMCEDCYEEMVAAAEAAYERAYYRE